MIQKQLDYLRDDLPKKFCTVPGLIPVDIAIPCCCAVDKLVSKDVQPCKYNGYYVGCILIFQGNVRRFLGRDKGVFLLTLCQISFSVIPKGRKNITIVQD